MWFVAAGIAVLALLLFVVRAQRQEAGEERQPGLPDAAVIRRIISLEDLGYVASLKCPRIRRLFHAERRRLLAAWMRAMRQAATQVYSGHVRSARAMGDLHPATEMLVALSFFRFMMTYSAIAGLVQILGPFHSQSFFRAFEILSAAMDGLARRAGAIQPMSQQFHEANGNFA